MNVLRLEDLRIQQSQFVLSATLSVSQGTRVAVIGPSGAGKSTLLAAIAGFITPAEGSVIWQDQDITHVAPGSRPVAMLFQDNNLFPHLSTAQNIGLGLRPDLRLSTAEENRVMQAMERVGLDGFGNRKPASLSGGQQSRVALARVLVQNSPLVLLDEPFSALGTALKTGMLKLVSELLYETGATLLMVSHDPEDARRIAHETIIVVDGVAHAPQETDSLLDAPPALLRDYLG